MLWQALHTTEGFLTLMGATPRPLADAEEAAYEAATQAAKQAAELSEEIALRKAPEVGELAEPSKVIVEICPKEDRDVLKPHLEQWAKTIKPGHSKVCLPGHRMHALLEELYKQGYSIIVSNIFVFYKPTQPSVTRKKENC